MRRNRLARGQAGFIIKSALSVLTNCETWFKLITERIEIMNKKNVLPHAGGGEPLNRIYYGRNIIVVDNNRRSCRDNVAKFDGQY